MFQDRDKCWALVNAVMNIQFHKTRGISWLAEDLLGSQEGLCSMEIVKKIMMGWTCSSRGERN
jgi:hypothetical protein